MPRSTKQTGKMMITISREPTADAPGFIILRAEDLEFYNDDIIRVFPEASSIRIETKEVELECYSEFLSHLTLFYKV